VSFSRIYGPPLTIGESYNISGTTKIRFRGTIVSATSVGTVPNFAKKVPFSIVVFVGSLLTDLGLWSEKTFGVETDLFTVFYQNLCLNCVAVS